MIGKLPTLLTKSLGGVLLSSLCLFSTTASAESTITFLGTETEIVDRDVKHGRTLSEVLSSLTNYCDALATNTRIRKHRNATDKRLRIHVSCLEHGVKKLEASNKRSHHRGKHHHHGHQKSGVITNEERDILKAIIQQFKDNGGVIVTPPEVTESVINGRVTTPAGAVVAGVSITTGQDQTVLTTTDANGNFSLMLEADLEHVIKLSAEGYATQVIPVQSPSDDGVINLDFTMIARGRTQTFDASTLSVLVDTDGAAVAISPNSFVDTNGDLVSGDIELTITPVDVSNSAILSAFPGEFAGIQTDLTETPIISLGTVEYKFTQNGEEVQLDSGATAQVLIPIYIPTYQDGTDILIGEEIPLWSLNEVTGIWEQEGNGVVVESTASPTGLAMQATVSHFTWWNCDVTMNAGTANISVTGTDAGTATIQATVSSCNIGWRATTVETVINIGETASNLSIPAACNVCYSAELALDSGVITNTATQCLTTPANGTSDITLQQFSPGPLNILANGSETAITVNSLIGYIPTKVQLSSATTEDSISFSIVSAQALPAGLSLNSISATQAEIVGLPTEAGDFAIEVQGTDATGAEVDSIIINYSIVDPSQVSAPLFVNDSIYFSLYSSFDLKPYNVGATATSWSLQGEIDGPGVPEWFTITNDGVVTVTGPVPVYDTWTGVVSATNSAGTVSTTVEVCTGDCIETPTPIPGSYKVFVTPQSSTNVFATEASVFVELDQPALEEITLNYSTSDGSALAGVDYVGVTNGVATIPIGESYVEIKISMLQNPLDDLTSKDFGVRVSNLSAGEFVEIREVIYDNAVVRITEGLIVITPAL